MSTVAAVKKITKAADVDLSGLCSTELHALAQTASKLRYSKQEEEADKKKADLIDNEVVATLKKKIKDLESEYKALPRKMSVTLNVPIKFDMNIKDKYDSLEDLVRSLSQYSYEYDISELLQDYKFSGKIITKDSNIDRIQKPYIDNAIEEMTENACEESLNLFSERKQLRSFVKKLNNVLKPVREAARDSGVSISFNTILGPAKE